MSQKKLFLQIDPLSSLKFATDTSIAIAQAVIVDNWEVYTYQPENLAYINGKIMAKAAKIELPEKGYILGQEEWWELEQGADIILIRQNPPFNMHYLTSCYLLQQVKKPIFNPPHVLINYPEKIIPLQFPELMAPTIISQNLDEIIEFIKINQQVVIKPLYSFGGDDIILIEQLTTQQIAGIKEKINNFVVVQKYITEITTKGDIRVLMSLDKVLAAFTRIPVKGSIISNMAAGGTPKPIELTLRQQEICETVGRFLKDNNIILAGLDIIGDYLTEVNITSPTGIKVANELYQLNLHQEIWRNIKNLAINKLGS